MTVCVQMISRAEIYRGIIGTEEKIEEKIRNRHVSFRNEVRSTKPRGATEKIQIQ